MWPEVNHTQVVLLLSWLLTDRVLRGLKVRVEVVIQINLHQSVEIHLI